MELGSARTQSSGRHGQTQDGGAAVEQPQIDGGALVQLGKQAAGCVGVAVGFPAAAAGEVLPAVADKAHHILQRIIQKNPEETVEYRLVDESGPAHRRSFTVQVLLNSCVIGTGTAGSKKHAEQLAAKEALELMGEQLGSEDSRG